jgi:hypothetical protein
MAITGLDSIYAARAAGKYNKGYFQKSSSNGANSVAGHWHEFFTAGGIPAAGSFGGSAGVATVMNAATQGAFNIGTASVSPDIRHATSLKMQSPTATLVPGVFYLVDYLLYYPACVVTGTPTTLNNTATLTRYTNGEGVMAMVAVQAANGGTQPALTLTYTDQGGLSSVGGVMTSPAASSAVSKLYLNNGSPFMPLATVDTGVRKIDSYTLSTGTTGTVAFVLVKILAEIDLYAINTGNLMNFTTGDDILPVIEDNACLGLIGSCGGAMIPLGTISGTLSNIWG